MDLAVERCVSFETPALEALPGFDVIRNVAVCGELEETSFADQTDTCSEDSVSRLRVFGLVSGVVCADVYAVVRVYCHL